VAGEVNHDRLDLHTLIECPAVPQTIPSRTADSSGSEAGWAQSLGTPLSVWRGRPQFERGHLWIYDRPAMNTTRRKEVQFVG